VHALLTQLYKGSVNILVVSDRFTSTANDDKEYRFVVDNDATGATISAGASIVRRATNRHCSYTRRRSYRNPPRATGQDRGIPQTATRSRA